jgi:hypothetical protein
MALNLSAALAEALGCGMTGRGSIRLAFRREWSIEQNAARENAKSCALIHTPGRGAPHRELHPVNVDRG